MHYKLPKDIRDICLAPVRGHSRGVSNYPGILQRLGAGQVELHPEVIRMRAVDAVILQIGNDMLYNNLEHFGMSYLLCSARGLEAKMLL